MSVAGGRGKRISRLRPNHPLDKVFGLPHHVDLTVINLDDSARFYEIVLSQLGFERTDLYSGGAPCWLFSHDDDFCFGIALHQAQNRIEHDRYSPGLHHLAFHASNRQQVDSFFDFLVENNITVLDPPAEYDYTPGYYAVFFSDPDGIKLEIVHEPHTASTAT